LLSLVFGGFAAVAQAQDELAPAPKPATPAGGSALIIAKGGTKKVQMRTGKRIRTALNENDTVIRVQQVQDDPSSVLIVGLEEGKAQVTLTDIDGKTETIDVIVQFDIEYLRTLIQRAVPTASVLPIPASHGAIILTGYVAHSEDVETVLKIVASVVGGAPGNVINALRVGGVMQVQLDVVIAEVNRNEIRYMDFEFMNFGSTHIFSNGMAGLLIPSAGITGSFPGPGVTVLNSIGQANTAPMNLFLGIFQPTQDFFGFLQLLRDEGVAKLLTQPKLVTLSGRPAHFVSGGEVPIPSAGGLGTTTVTFKPVGTLITLLPVVLGNGKIHLEVEPEVSEPTTPTAST